VVDVRPSPGLAAIPFAEVWFHAIDDDAWAEASERARALGKTGLEVWTTTRTPEVAAFLEARGYVEHRRYVISELDVASAPEEPPALPVTTFAEHPELADELYALARVAYADQPGRSETVFGDEWYEWGLRAHRPDAYFVVLEDDRLLGYGYLEEDPWGHGFTAVARDARGRGVAGAIKRAQIAWAKEHGIATLRTANEVRLTGMLDLNRRLGYCPLYEEVIMRGPIRSSSRRST
jgi:GNAT superfamily N-acetyltransferase